ncbi:MAG: SPASM domain-containing protein [Candidatus Portnoybacteria bacterium]|nr:SPASM domain-containing protein [Candidatus Portnoybacteria bacterium]
MLNKIKRLFLLVKNGQFDLLAYKIKKRLGFKNLLPPLPFWLVVEPANVCNLKCPICPTGSGKLNRPPRMMSFAEFKKIIDEVRGYVGKIVLFNYGEPFLNKDIFEMIRYAVDAKMRLKISTNGDLLNSKEICQKIIKSGLQYLIISLDGIDQETHSCYRRGSNINNVIGAINYLNEAKKELNLKTPKIELQFILMKHNQHQREQMKEMAAKLGVDIYSEKSLNLYRSEFEDGAKEFLPSDLSESRYYIKDDGALALKGEIINDCGPVNTSAVINSDGTVVPCCYDLYSEHIMGNVFEESLKSIWRNRKYQAFRNLVETNKGRIPICQVCPEGREICLSKKVAV